MTDSVWREPITAAPGGPELGTVVIHWRDQRTPTNDDHEFLRFVAELASLAIAPGRFESARALRRVETEQGLRAALDNDQLRVLYQPQVCLVTGATIGAEALVRWDHPTRGLLTPEHFLSVAEDSGLIREIGAWVLREACTHLAKLQARGERLTISVNLSARQLEDPAFVDEVASIVAAAGVDPHDVCLEITETVLIREAAFVCAALDALRELGMQIGIDDFGTGYASLAYLKQLPVDLLKIDMSFVRGLGTDPRDEAITGALVDLAETLGLRVIAEGVETERQRARLIALGCPSAQGYLFSRPLSPAAFDEWLDTNVARGAELELDFATARFAAPAAPRHGTACDAPIVSGVTTRQRSRVAPPANLATTARA